MPRFFTLLEAEEALPEVERLLRGMMDSRQEYVSADGELNGIAQRIALAGGMVPPHDRVVSLRSRKDASARSLKGALERIQQIGCLLKDIETGLIDFPSLYKEREVYLCWKLGESGIGFWHNVEDGFRGRRPIDSEFLSNHRGEG